jgi:hypothetical protein
MSGGFSFFLKTIEGFLNGEQSILHKQVAIQPITKNLFTFLVSAFFEWWESQNLSVDEFTS